MFEVRVRIENPEKTKSTEYLLECEFLKEENGYGNGYHLSISGKEFSAPLFPGMYYDIRYDTAFRSDEMEEYLVSWAKKYWSGKNGAWTLKSVEVTRP